MEELEREIRGKIKEYENKIGTFFSTEKSDAENRKAVAELYSSLVNLKINKNQNTLKPIG